MNDYFIGLDIGTSSVRAVLFDSAGMQVSIDNIEYCVVSPANGHVELHPDSIFDSTIKVIKACSRKSEAVHVAGIGISCQMHSLMGVDRHGNPITELITWGDTRAKKESEFIKSNYDVGSLYHKTGCRVQHPMYPLSKILWLKSNAVATFNSIYKFITIKEYIIYKLFNEFVVDYTLAASQGYFNIHKQDWDEDITGGILGINRNNLSEIVECGQILKGMRLEYANAMGIDRNIPVVIGSGDGIMANLGCGICDDTAFSSTIGTSGAIRTAVGSPLLDPYQQTWCYSFTKDMWVAGGAINNGGLALQWLRDEFKEQFEYDASLSGEGIYTLFDRLASEIKPGSDGLVFLPCLTGERSPDWNADARGLMFGLGLSHGRKHIIRAAMEGILYRMYSIYEAMVRLRDNARQITANGGYTKSNTWLQMQADIFNKEIQVSATAEASALGAAFLCMVSLGAASGIRDALPGMKPDRIIYPIKENHEVYKEMYRLSKQVYNSIYNKPVKGE